MVSVLAQGRRSMDGCQTACAVTTATSTSKKRLCWPLVATCLALCLLTRVTKGLLLCEVVSFLVPLPFLPPHPVPGELLMFRSRVQAVEPGVSAGPATHQCRPGHMTSPLGAWSASFSHLERLVLSFPI